MAVGEECFPRGGASSEAAKPRMDREKKGISVSSDFFFASSGSSRDWETKRRKRLSTRKPRGAEDEEAEDGLVVSGEVLERGACQPGLLVLAAVVEVAESRVTTELPNGIRAFLHAPDVSKQLTQAIKEGQVSSLEGLFRKGQLLPALITESGAQKGSKAKRKLVNEKKGGAIKLTTDPHRVNGGLPTRALRAGLPLLAVVVSEEDKGYQMDIGKKGVTAFLPQTALEPGMGKLTPGQPLLTLVTRVDGEAESATGPRAVILSASASALSAGSVCLESESVPLDELVPGMVLATTFHSAGKHGMSVQLGPHRMGEIAPKQLPPAFRSDPAKLIARLSADEGAKAKKRGRGGLGELLCDGRVRVLVTAARPNSAFLCLSASPHLLRLGADAARAATLSVEGLRVGDILRLPVASVSARPAVHFSLEDVEGAAAAGLSEAVVALDQLQLPPKEAHTRDREELLLHYAVGSKHRLRVTGVRLMDGVLLATTKAEALKQKIVSLEEATPGMLFKAARVERVAVQGIYVRVYENLRGFIPLLHTADKPLTNITKAVKEGAKLKACLLYVDKERRQLVLTRKASMVDTELPIVSSFSQANVGLTTMGMVIKVTEGGALVTMFNRTAGFIRKSEFAAAGVFDHAKLLGEGSPIRVRVASVAEAEEKMILEPVGLEAQAQTDEKPPKGGKKVKADKPSKGAVKSAKRLLKELSIGQDYKLSVDVDAPQVAFIPVRFVEHPGLSGRIHVTELAEEFPKTQAGESVVSAFLRSLGKARGGRVELSGRLVGYTSLLRRNRDGLKKVPELSLRPKEATRKRDDYKVGSVVHGAVTEVRPTLGLRLSVSPTWVANVPLLQTTASIAELRHFKDTFKVGAGIAGAVVTAVSKEDKSLTVSCIPTQQKEGSAVLGQLSRRQKRSEGGGLCFQLPGHRSAIADITTLTDDYDDILSVQHSVAKGEIMKLTLLKAWKAQKGWAVGLRKKKAPKDPLILERSQLKPGQLLRGFVVGWAESGLFVRLGPGLDGFVSRPNSLWPQEEAFDAARRKPLLPLTTLVSVKVLDLGSRLVKPMLSLLESDTGVAADAIPVPIKEDETEEIFHSRRELRLGAKRAAKEEDVKEEEDLFPTNPAHNFPPKKRAKVAEQEPEPEPSSSSSSEDEAMEEEASSESEAEVVSVAPKAAKAKAKTPAKETTAAGEAWDWDPEGFRMEDMVALALGKDGGSANPASGEREPKEEEGQGKKKRSAFERDRATEAAVFRREQALLDPARGLEAPEDFDRALVGTPHSSLLWIRYMAWELQANKGGRGLDAARGIAAKALKAIPAEEAEEKLNLWTALLNLENAEGDEDSLRSVLNEALRSNDQLKVYRQMIKILQNSAKSEAAAAMFEEAHKACGGAKGVDWYVEWAGHLFGTGAAEAGRALMKRAVKALPKAKHVELLSRFGRLEFLSGEAERGRTLFESLLSAYPKRADVWALYLDMLAKFRPAEESRVVLERVTGVGLTAHKARAFFKRWLELETRVGTAKSQEAVRERAKAFVSQVEEKLGL